MLRSTICNKVLPWKGNRDLTFVLLLTYICRCRQYKSYNPDDGTDSGPETLVEILNKTPGNHPERRKLQKYEPRRKFES
jgi:hypothetical protein